VHSAPAPAPAPAAPGAAASRTTASTPRVGDERTKAADASKTATASIVIPDRAFASSEMLREPPKITTPAAPAAAPVPARPEPVVVAKVDPAPVSRPAAEAAASSARQGAPPPAREAAATPERLPAAAPSAAPRSAGPLTSSEYAKLIDDARKLFVSGQVSKARELLMPHANRPVANLQMAIGRTFDPNYISRISAPDSEPNPSTAMRHYGMAAQLGSDAAAQDMRELARIYPELAKR
jgi:hypothetical protein